MPKRVLLILALGACSSRPDDTALLDSAHRDSAAPIAAAPPDTTPREIYIDSVIAGNPLKVYGRARTFENNVQVRVRSAAGDSLAQTFTTSDGEMGHHNPFVVEIQLKGGAPPRLIVEAFEYSAKDGSVRSQTSREVSNVPRP